MLRILSLAFAPLLAAQDYSSWRDYGGGPASAQYSSLTQINKSNVSKLEVAWTYPIGDGKRYSFSPVVAGDKVFVMGAGNAIVCLDGATGKEVWVHKVPVGTTAMTNRGINFWESKDRSESRLFYASNHVLRAIDAKTGKAVEGFAVNLKEGLDRDPNSFQLVQSLSPGKVFEDLLIVGSATNQGYGSAPGDIRAFDARTGKHIWSFRTVPRAGEFGADTWPKDARKNVGGANVWADMSVDEKRGILYAPTASAKYNFYGADRLGANLFSDSLLALDVRTGKRLWHYQFVHHDIWDYDGAAAPKLLTIERNGKKVDAVALATKHGFLYVFDRVTGAPVFPIEEKPFPASDVDGEVTSKTQPVPTALPPFSRQKFTVDDLSPYLSTEDRAKFRDQLLSARNEGLFTPPSKRGAIQFPGNNGGANWGGTAVVPDKGTMVVVSKDLPSLLRLEEKGKWAEMPRYESGFGFMIASDGTSAIKPPWTSMTVYDLNAGKIKWQIPLGEVPELAAKGIKNTGTHHPKVGPVVTSTGLIFTGTRDKKVRAFDIENGKMLFEKQVDAAIEGVPAVYEAGGRQFIVFCASGQAGLIPAKFEEIKGAYVAFALPR